MADSRFTRCRRMLLRGFLERKALSYYLCIDRGTSEALAFKTSNLSSPKLWKLNLGEVWDEILLPFSSPFSVSVLFCSLLVLSRSGTSKCTRGFSEHLAFMLWVFDPFCFSKSLFLYHLPPEVISRDRARQDAQASPSMSVVSPAPAH